MPATARQQRARLILKGIRRLLGEVRRKTHRLGTQLNKLNDHALYRDLGYDSLRAMLKGERLIPHSTARRFMAIARTFTEAELAQLGTEKAYALITYVDATPEPDVARLLLQLDAPILDRPLSEHTGRSLHQATQRVRHQAQLPTPPRRATVLAQTLQKHFRRKGARSTTVALDKQDGRWFVDIRIAIDDADNVLQ